MAMPWPPDSLTTSLISNTYGPPSTYTASIAECRRPSGSRRKFSLVKLIKSRTSSAQDLNPEPPSSQDVARENFSTEVDKQLPAQVTSHVDKATGVSLLELAEEDLKKVPAWRRQSVLEEYIRIPRKNCRLLDILEVEEGNRAGIRESVRKAREKLREQLGLEPSDVATEENSRGQAERPKKDLKDKYRLTLGTEFWGMEKKRKWKHGSLGSAKEIRGDDQYSDHSSWRRSTRSSSMSSVPLFRNSFADQVLEMVARASEEERLSEESTSPTDAGSRTRLLPEVEKTKSLTNPFLTPPESPKQSPTNYVANPQVQHYIPLASTSSSSNPPNLRPSPANPSLTNPFASFLTSPATAPYPLPPDLQAFQDAHNEVQDTLRSSLRHSQDFHTSAAQLSLDFLNSVQKQWDECALTDERTGGMKTLGREECVELWARCFWERCCKEGW